MADDLPVRGTILSSSPCTIKDAATMLRSFLESETVPEADLMRGYLVSVSDALEELEARRLSSKRKDRSGKHDKAVHESADDKHKHEKSSGLNGQPENSEAEQQVRAKKRKVSSGKHTESQEKSEHKSADNQKHEKSLGLNGQPENSEVEPQVRAKKRKVSMREHTESQQKSEHKAADDNKKHEKSPGVNGQPENSHVEQQVRAKKRKDRSGKHAESQHKSADVQKHDKSPGLNGQPANPKVEQQQVESSHLKRKDRGVEVEKNELDVREKKHKKRRTQERCKLDETPELRDIGRATHGRRGESATTAELPGFDFRGYEGRERKAQEAEDPGKIQSGRKSPSMVTSALPPAIEWRRAQQLQSFNFQELRCSTVVDLTPVFENRQVLEPAVDRYLSY